MEGQGDCGMQEIFLIWVAVIQTVSLIAGEPLLLAKMVAGRGSYTESAQS